MDQARRTRSFALRLSMWRLPVPSALGAIAALVAAGCAVSHSSSSSSSSGGGVDCSQTGCSAGFTCVDDGVGVFCAASCSTDGDCTGTCCLPLAEGGGYCAADASSCVAGSACTPNCSVGATCITVGSGTACASDCIQDSDCPGTCCVGLDGGDGSVCAPDTSYCGTPGACPGGCPIGETCNLATGTCENGSMCSVGAPCTASDPCRTAAIGCSTGSPVCIDDGDAPDGTPCGSGQQCSGGVCAGSCVGGAPCAASDPCRTATIQCISGSPVCVDTGSSPDGTACAAGEVCLSGTCTCRPDGSAESALDNCQSCCSGKCYFSEATFATTYCISTCKPGGSCSANYDCCFPLYCAGGQCAAMQ